MNITSAFILTFLAGISTVLGVIPIFFKVSKKVINLVFKISFLTLIIISIFELIPDSFRLINRHYNIIFSLIILFTLFYSGFLLTKLLDNKVGKGESKYYKIGIISMLAMIIHNIPEGIITYITTTNDLKLGILISLSIMLHNIPEGLLIATPIYYAKKKRGLALLLTFISGISEFLGALLSYLFLSNYITDLILGLIYAFTAGIMMCVALHEIYPVIKEN